MNYSALTRRYFERADGSGVLSGPRVVRGAAGALAQGTWVQFDLAWRVRAAGPPEIEAARFLAFGCPHTIAVASWVVERSSGEVACRNLPENVHGLARRFDVPVAKLGRLLIVEDAWAAAANALLAAAGTPATGCAPKCGT
jgi:hypothetical protein